MVEPAPVYAIVSIYNNPELVPHFTRHYARLGVRHIFLVVRSVEDEALLESTRRAASDSPSSVHLVPCERFDDDEKDSVQRSILDGAGVGLDDYVMFLDLDEFQQYPRPLAAVVRELEDAGHWALRGSMIDRVARDGSLAEIRDDRDLGDQFPLACELTRNLLGGCVRKTLLSRRHVRLRFNHDPVGIPSERIRIVEDGEHVTHHFKWTARRDRLLAARLERDVVPIAYRSEVARFLSHYQAHGRIDCLAAGAPPWVAGALHYGASAS